MTVTPGRYGAEVDALLEGLDATQRDAVTSRAAPLAILAGAGSGKTRVLTRRIAWQSSEELIDPAHTLAVTFTRKAAGELRVRLARLGVRESVTAGTFHAIALAQLRRRADEQGRAMPELLDRKVRILMRLLPNRGREGSPLFLVNHWITTDPLPRPSNAEKVNAYVPLLHRLQECKRIREHMPNLVAVDFYRRGDLMRAVDAINGVKPDQ